MAQRIMTELWDYIAQQFRDTIVHTDINTLDYRLSENEYSIAETAWRSLGSCFEWYSVLTGATSSDEVLKNNPEVSDIVQASSDGFLPGMFPESLPSNPDVLLSRTDDIVAQVGALLNEIPSAMRQQLFELSNGATHSGDEIVARIMYLISYSTGQMRLLRSHAKHT
jgi:hypothetical protein